MSGTQKVVVIVGPTASGKSALGVELALRYHGEIISADSRQIYRGLDIGTAKITEAEKRGVPHHLLDIRDPHETYTAHQFAADADTAIAGIANRGKLPIIVGGTFFYIDTLLGKAAAAPVAPNLELRAELEEEDAATLMKRLQRLDPARVATIDQNNKRRIMRAIEIATALGSVPGPQKNEGRYDALILGIKVEKEELQKRYEERAQTWLSSGFKDEITALQRSGITQDRLRELGFEYALGIELMEGRLDEATFIARFIERNWQYAKRQYTWLKRDPAIRWVYPSEKAEVDLLVEQFLIN
jgi:tRNA dimethylallyltransferase